MRYWLLKQEPEEFSWHDLMREGIALWDGVRNYQARNNLNAMEAGDLAFFYHSVSDKQVMGVIRIAEAAFPDPTTDDARWVAVRVTPVVALNQPVKLEQIKAEPGLAQIALLRQSRLSVMPLTAEEFGLILALGNTPHPKLS